MGLSIPSEAKEAAEKGSFLSKTPEKHASGPKGPLILMALYRD